MKQITLVGVNYRVVKKYSVMGQKIIDAYNYYEGVTLRDVYGSYSMSKENSFNWCRSRMYELNGFGLVITSHNIFQFTCAFEFVHTDKKHYIAYFTRDNNYVVCLED